MNGAQKVGRLSALARLMGSVATAAALLLVHRSAQAQTFSSIAPPNCTTATYTEAPLAFHIGSPNNTIHEWDTPIDPNWSGGGTHYINNLYLQRWVIGNSWTDRIQLRVDAFRTEADYDLLTFVSQTTSGGTWGGTPTTPLWGNLQVTSGSLQSKFASMVFTSDGSVTDTGITVARMRACTSRTSADTAVPQGITWEAPYTGMVMGSNDTVFVKHHKDPSYHLGISMWGEPGVVGTDLDVYARCGAKPTPTQYEFRGYSNDAQEFIDYTNSCPGDVYIAVNAYSANANAFHLALGRHYSGWHRTIRVGTNTPVTPAVLADFAKQLSQGAKFDYGATEGNLPIDRFDLYNDTNNCETCGPGDCEICMMGINGRSHAGSLCAGGQILIYIDQTDPMKQAQNIGHEMLHQYYCLPDEYTDNVGINCGHSVMGLHKGSNHNLCNSRDHNLDESPVGVPNLPFVDADTLGLQANVGTLSSNMTYDNFTYMDFDFNDMLGVVVTH